MSEIVKTGMYKERARKYYSGFCEKTRLSKKFSCYWEKNSRTEAKIQDRLLFGFWNFKSTSGAVEEDFEKLDDFTLWGKYYRKHYKYWKQYSQDQLSISFFHFS